MNCVFLACASYAFGHLHGIVLSVIEVLVERCIFVVAPQGRVPQGKRVILELYEVFGDVAAVPGVFSGTKGYQVMSERA